MQRKRRVTWFILGLLVYLTATNKSSSAQEMLGVTLGNYSGVTSIMVNPAMIANTRYYLDINLASADFFFRNNFAYIPASDASIYSLIRNPQSLPVYGPDDQNFTFYDNQDLKFVTLSTKILGPSVMLQYGKHAFALSTGAQLFVSANRIPYEMPLFGYYGMDNPSLFNINFIDYDYDASVAAWMNVGASYAYTVYEYLDQKLTVGATVRYLWSYAGAYTESSNTDYIVLNDSVININNLNGTGGFALPIDYGSSSQMLNEPFFKGHGYGVDLGVVYVKKKNIDVDRWDELCEQEFEDYTFRLGVSILDLGTMTYKSNAQLHTYDDVSVYWENYDTTNYTNINQLMGELSNLFYGDPTASYAGDKIKIGLPTAISVQADYNIFKDFYAGGYWIQPIRLNRHTLRRPPQIAIVPRYETKYLEFSIPVSILEYRYPRVGLSARFWFFTIGTERLGTWLGLANLDGLDIYASIKFGFGKGFCRSKFKGACTEDMFKNKKKKRSKINRNLVF